MSANSVAKQAVILAAGRGSRLGHLTDVMPKCLTLVAGRTLLDWMLGALRDAGMERVLIVGGYRYDALESYRSPSVSTMRYAHWADTNMLGTLQAAHAWLAAAPCLIAYSDIAVRPAHLASLRAATGDIVVANNTQWRTLWAERFQDPLHDAETFAAEVGMLRNIGGRATEIAQIGGQFMGLVKTTPQGWAQLNALMLEDSHLARKGDTTELLTRALQADVPIHVVDCAGGWIEVDSESDLRTVERGLMQENWAHEWRN
jgi:L-glutamine-phosphate cytidylyltransferase